MTDEPLHIQEIPAHELRADDWYIEMGTKQTVSGLWWRIITDIKVYGDEGDIRNQVHMKFAGDDATYAALLNERVLVRGPISAFNKKDNP